MPLILNHDPDFCRLSNPMAGVRGLCNSPLSSGDEADNAASSSSFTFVSLPTSKSSRGKSHVTGKRMSKAKKTIQQSKKLKHTPSEWLTNKSTKQLIKDAPHDFVEYLAEQMSVIQQAKFETEFGGGQGYIVKLAPSTWKSKRQRDELGSWMRALGFASGTTLSHNALRIASLKANVILSELSQRVSSIVDKGEETGADTELVGNEIKLLTNDWKEEDGDCSTDPEMIRLKMYFEKLESQKLEVLSFAENHRLLSSTQHRKIADAMEDVLAQPSLRRERRFARRRSQIGRPSSGRRLSAIGLVSSPSSFLPPAEDDWVWDREMDKMSLTPVKRRVSIGGKKVVKKKNLAGERVLYLVLQSGVVDVKSFKQVLPTISTMVYAWIVADYSEKVNFCSKTQLYSRHPCGHYLTNGAYKEVFKVYSAVANRLEAISVMDISVLEDMGNEKIVRQEVAHSVLLSHATTCGICPNFLRIYDVFVANEQPRADLWGDKTHRKPIELLGASSVAHEGFDSENLPEASEDDNERLFQYIRMEFCDGGDLEHFIGLQKDKTLPLASVALPFFFQMVFGLYCARERFNLRHCDIKLLNFFLKDIGRTSLRNDPKSDVVLHYLLEDACFVLQMPASFSYWVKLADYGTADSNPENLGTPVTFEQFTTLENSPIEFLLEGDAAEQSYAADTFSLGLCLLHLFTGNAPYEEILEDVHCPIELQKDLKFIWMQKKTGFSVLKSAAHGDDENTFCHTLYRFVVLFGLPECNPSERKGIDKVWKLLLKHLRPEDGALNQLQRRSRRKGGVRDDHLLAKVQFDHDQSLYSIATGSNKSIRRCREGLQTIPGAMDLLTKLVDFDPTKRPTLKQVMFHPMFSSFRALSRQKKAPPPDYVISYYKRRQSQKSQVIRDV